MKYTRKDLRKSFVANLMFYQERGCVNFNLTTNKTPSKHFFDTWNMGSFGRSLALSDLLDEDDKEGFDEFCEMYLWARSRDIEAKHGFPGDKDRKLNKK